MTPSEDELWFLPLGGCGEIGMNLNLFGHDGQWLMVDCGVTFARPGETGPHVQMADPAFIETHRDKLAGLIVTHAHEDHLGAVEYLWDRLQCPIYTNAFSAAILRRKLGEAGMLGRVPIEVVSDGERRRLGPFDVQWLGLTHSTPETQALMLRTPCGAVFHTADWKLDPDPVLGDPIDAARFQALADETVNAMVCDSTNALTPGRSVSEGELFDGLHHWVAEAPGRVIVGCFGSNVARLKMLARVAEATGRYAALLGRSMRNYYTAALTAGVWDTDYRFVDPAHLGYLPRNEVLAIATGSQGEPRAALDRLSAGNLFELDLDPGDLVLMSSRVIPGNEASVERLYRRLAARGVTVIADEALNMPIHASGHPAREELADMYRWVAPELAIPVHGEPEHMDANAQLAASVGVPRQLRGENGDLFMIAPVPGIRRGAVPAGRLGLDGRRLVTVPLA